MKVEILSLVEKSNFCDTQESILTLLTLNKNLLIKKNLIKLEDREMNDMYLQIHVGHINNKNETYISIELESKILKELSLYEDKELNNIYTLSEEIRKTIKHISSNAIINTLWDDVGRAYAIKAYTHINSIENTMRKFIAKFMIVTVGFSEFKNGMTTELKNKIDKFNEPDEYTNDLFKLDFIQINNFLFEKKRDLTLEQLDRILSKHLSKNTINSETWESIKKYYPSSNWEKYFSFLFEDIKNNKTELEKEIKETWEKLYKLRNHIAHNRYIKYEDYRKIIDHKEHIQKSISLAESKIQQQNVKLTKEQKGDIIDDLRAIKNHEKDYKNFLLQFYIENGYSISYDHKNQFLDFLAIGKMDVIAVVISNSFSLERLMYVTQNAINNGLYINQIDFIYKFDFNTLNISEWSDIEKYISKIAEEHSIIVNIFTYNGITINSIY